jgi:HTH-type transcriptional regulator/antitoxin HigA
MAKNQYNMETLKYKVISSAKQYYKYCNVLEKLFFAENKKTKEQKDEIALLTLLIEKWDFEHRTFRKLNPIELIKSLMDDHKMKAKDLAEVLGVNKSYVSEILNYKKGLSKEVIRKLSVKFKIYQEAFNRYYAIKSENNKGHKYERMMNMPKKLEFA